MEKAKKDSDQTREGTGDDSALTKQSQRVKPPLEGAKRTGKEAKPAARPKEREAPEKATQRQPRGRR